MNALFVLFLFLHIVAAIVAFGPTFAFPLIAGAAQKERQHAAFAAEVNILLEDKLVIPFALSMPVTGALLIITGGINLFEPWLLLAILVYIVAIGYSLMVQTPAAKEMAQLLKAMPASPGPGAVAAEAVGGPPPRLAELGKQMQRGGMILAGLLLVIIALMIVGGETTFLH